MTRPCCIARSVDYMVVGEKQSRSSSIEIHSVEAVDALHDLSDFWHGESVRAIVPSINRYKVEVIFGINTNG